MNHIEQDVMLKHKLVNNIRYLNFCQITDEYLIHFTFLLQIEFDIEVIYQLQLLFSRFCIIL